MSPAPPHDDHVFFTGGFLGSATPSRSGCHDTGPRDLGGEFWLIVRRPPEPAVTGCYSPRLFRDRAQSELFAQKHGGQVDSFRTRAEALLKLSAVGVSAGARRSTSKESSNASSSQSNGHDAGAAQVQVYEDDLDDSETDTPAIVISTSD